MRIAVMQPYLWPYAGYYRLLAGADAFVIFDCVQHIRRGRIHRNEFTRADGSADWLTLPVAKAGQSARIDALRFSANADSEFATRLQRFPLVARACSMLGLNAPLPGGNLAEWLEIQLRATAGRLELPCRILRSSGLALADELRAGDRILAICQALGADRYLNVAGGADLYDAAQFADRGIALQILPPYRGSFRSLNERLLDESAASLRNEIVAALEAA